MANNVKFTYFLFNSRSTLILFFTFIIKSSSLYILKRCTVIIEWGITITIFLTWNSLFTTTCYIVFDPTFRVYKWTTARLFWRTFFTFKDTLNVPTSTFIILITMIIFSTIHSNLTFTNYLIRLHIISSICLITIIRILAFSSYKFIKK